MGIWILIAIILSFLVFLATQRSSLESFQDATTDVEPYERLQIRMCPQSAPVVQTAKGYTDCCKGDFIDGKCKGQTVATLSPAHDGIETVVDYWRGIFTEKSKECPTTMTYYYEDVQRRGTGFKGCSTQQPLVDGQKDPTSERSCVIYPNMDDNYNKTDSCYIEKIRSQQICPPNGTRDAKIQEVLVPSKGLVVFCNGFDSNGLPFTCYEDEIAWRYLREKAGLTKLPFEEFKTNSPWSDILCSNFEVAQAKRLDAKRRADEEAQKVRQANQRASDAQKRYEAADRERRALLQQVKRCRR